MENANLKINSVPSITWNWLKSNYDTISVNNTFYEYAPEVSAKEGLEIAFVPDAFENKTGSGVFNISTPKAKDLRNADGTETVTIKPYKVVYTSNHPLQKLIKETVKKPQVFTVSKKLTEPVMLNFAFNGTKISSQIIHVNEGCKATFILVYTGTTPLSFVSTKIIADKNAEVTVIKVQLLDTKSVLLDDTAYYCDDESSAKFIQLELGGSHNNSGLHTTLSGYKANFTSEVAYLCKDSQQLDMNHIVYHTGKKTECKMLVDGTIKDSAVKAYRGTIDFKNGCSGSKGNEMEETLILNRTCTNKSLPAILCDEEDVEGEHGATIGRLSKEILFYMQSRGISEEQAEQIMARAKIQAVSDLIPSEDVKQLISNFLDKEFQ